MGCHLWAMTSSSAQKLRGPWDSVGSLPARWVLPGLWREGGFIPVPPQMGSEENTECWSDGEGSMQPPRGRTGVKAMSLKTPEGLAAPPSSQMRPTPSPTQRDGRTSTHGKQRPTPPSAWGSAGGGSTSAPGSACPPSPCPGSPPGTWGR